jgi:glutamate-1-semialdehyde 2,1-aminomutase
VAAHDGMSRDSEEDTVILPYGDTESVELILRQHRDELAGVFYDPKAGIYDIPRDFAQFLRDITRELGLLLVWDEVVSFRAGYGGYQAVCGIEPDLTTFGKIVGGGLPVGALGGRADLMDVLDNTQDPTGLTQSGTFSGNAMTLAAGLATLRELTPEVYSRLERLRARLHEGLEAAFEDAGVACRVVSEGPLVNVYLTDRPVRTYRDAASADKGLSDRIALSLLLKGFFGWGGLGLALSTPMGDEHVDGLLTALAAVLVEPEA